jgi:D-3-phosphoglycerate dehydrogenase
MSAIISPRKTVVRFNTWYDIAMEERFSREPDIDLVTCDRDDLDGTFASLATAHAYQISSAKDELPAHWFANAALLSRCPNLLCVSSNGAGYDTIDVEACTEAGVLVVNQAGGNANAVAEHTMGVLLSLTRRLAESDRRLRRERGFKREDMMGSDLAGKVVGLVGIGHAGRRVAALARAFGMSVVAYDPYLTSEDVATRGARAVGLDRLLAEADIVSLHCPRTPETLGMFGADAFRTMKRGAIFITTARGGIHDEIALAEALENGHLIGAAVDVWDREPPPLNHPLLRLDNVIATYHTAGVTHEARRTMASFAAEQIVSVLRGDRPPRLVNPAVWPKYMDRFRSVMGSSISGPGSAA